MDAKVVINILVELAGLEEELAAARDLLSRNEAQARGLDELQAEYRQDADQAESKGRSAEASFRNREGEIRLLEARLADRRRLLAGLEDPRQSEALRREIDVLAGRVDELETEALEILDEAGAERREAETARRECQEQEERRAREQAAMRDRSARAAAAEPELAAQIERLVGLLPEPVSRHVRRLRTGLARSVAFLEGGACGGCYAQLPPQQGLAADRGTMLVRCASCSRYVVHRPWR